MKKIIFLMTIFLIQLTQASDLLIDNNIEKRNLIEDSFSKIDSLQYAEKEKISGFKAALYSAVLPGAGQYYAESYWRAAIYATLEVAVWTTYFIYDSKGDKKDVEMRDYGDTHWSERKYWSKLYEEALRNPNITVILGIETELIDGDPWIKDYNSGIANQLRFLEDALGYSHSLPSTHTQQYYEMIYKYPHQFANGWSDAGFLTPYLPDASDLPNTARYYRDLRNLTEEYYDVAKGATMAALVNHVISAFDAALAAKAYNRSFQMRFTVNNKYLPNEKVRMYGFQFKW
jgi:uncharacterized protein DUF5683